MLLGTAAGLWGNVNRRALKRSVPCDAYPTAGDSPALRSFAAAAALASLTAATSAAANAPHSPGAVQSPGAQEAVVVLLSSAPLLGANGLPAGWEPLLFKKIPRTTTYEWSAAEGALHAVSSASAAGLIYRLDRAAGSAPVLRWRWKVSGTLPKGDERAKSGDDYAARLYVTFRYDPRRAGAGMRFKYGLAKTLYGEHPPHAGINYIWANRLAQGEAVANAYTDRVRMLAVRSGDAEAGRWLSEERDILADYRKLFGEEPPPLAGVAVMTDTDNTGGRAEAWYAQIELAARAP